jgi:hypothetical protein
LADLECGQKPEELIQWMCRMADGEDAHSFLVLSRATNEAADPGGAAASSRDVPQGRWR